MNRLSCLLTALFVLGLASAAEAQTQTGPKIGYINSQQILAEAPGAQAAQSRFEQEMQGYRTEVQTMATELEQMIQQYEQQQLTLSPDAKQRREQEIRTRQQAYQQRVQELDEIAGERQQELVQPIMDEINRVIEDIRAQGAYTLIFDVSAGSIIAADPSLDLTDEVIRQLAGTPGSGSPPGPRR